MHECGDKLVKLCLQVVIRHLNFIMDKISERKTLPADKILFVLEDLHQLQIGIDHTLVPQIVQRVVGAASKNGHQADEAQILENFVKPLINQVSRRFELLTKPCISAISKKI